MKQFDRSSSSKGLIFPPTRFSQYSCLDEGSNIFPSVFSSPFTKASLCSFLLAMPTSNQFTPSSAFSSLSTLAFLSMSFSIKTRNVSSGLDEQNHAAPTSSIIATIATALRSLQSSRNYNEQNLKESKDVFRRSSTKPLKRGSLEVSTLGRSAKSKNERMPDTVSLQATGNGFVSNLGSQNGSEHNLSDVRDGMEAGVAEEQQKNISKQRAEKRAAKMGNITKFLVSEQFQLLLPEPLLHPWRG